MAQGEQWLIDIYDFPKITAKKSLEILLGVVQAMRATVLSFWEKETKSENVAYILIAESHLIVNDYKNGLANLDIFTCGGKNMQTGFDYIQKEIGFTEYKFILKTKRFEYGKSRNFATKRILFSMGR